MQDTTTAHAHDSEEKGVGVMGWQKRGYLWLEAFHAKQQQAVFSKVLVWGAVVQGWYYYSTVLVQVYGPVSLYCQYLCTVLARYRQHVQYGHTVQPIENPVCTVCVCVPTVYLYWAVLSILYLYYWLAE